ncbi:RNA polymerase sigma factor [Streptomyces achromogenes]|uniref:RNA polymerase sigma factor n=1 Tax=Streptomyces achromogenes TaxID=67255 RepID=UPI003414A179
MSDGTPRDAAFDAWCRATYPRTLARLRRKRRSLPLHDAQEIVQDAYHKVYEHWTEIENPDGFLWDVTCKLTIDHWRKRQAAPVAPVDWAEEFGTTPAPECDQPETCVEHRHLIGVMKRLSSDDQRVLLMHVHGSTKEEQAEALATTADTARVRLHRAKKRLEQLVTQDEEEAQQ